MQRSEQRTPWRLEPALEKERGPHWANPAVILQKFTASVKVQPELHLAGWVLRAVTSPQWQLLRVESSVGKAGREMQNQTEFIRFLSDRTSQHHQHSQVAVSSQRGVLSPTGPEHGALNLSVHSRTAIEMCPLLRSSQDWIQCHAGE